MKLVKIIEIDLLIIIYNSYIDHVQYLIHTVNMYITLARYNSDNKKTQNISS